MTQIGIYGANGRIGRMIELYSREEKDARFAMFYDRGGNLDQPFEKSEVIIGFSSPLGISELIAYARITPKPLVIGTTGLDEKTMQTFYNASEVMPIFYATNMSLGAAVLNHLAIEASAMLKEFDMEILGMHHRHKKDAPGGTAMTLATSVAKARNLELSKVRINGRDGLTGERSKDGIAVISLRDGNVVGRHTVGFYEEGEFLELHHTATSRATFAKGAIKIAKWLHEKEAGLYSISDFLGI